MPTCVVCGKPFEAKANTKTCSKEHSAINRSRKRAKVDVNLNTWYIGKGEWSGVSHWVNYETGKTACGRMVRLKPGEYYQKTPDCLTCQRVYASITDCVAVDPGIVQ